MKRAGLIALLVPTAALAQGPEQPPAAVPASVAAAAHPGNSARRHQVPPLLTDAERTAYAAIFRDLAAGHGRRAAAALAALPDGELTPPARAALILARGAAHSRRAELAAFLAAHPDLPDAPAIARLAASLPAADAAPLPLLPDVRPIRTAAAGFSITPGPADAELAMRLRPLLADDRNAEAERLWLAGAAVLSPWARSDWAARIAWNHYRMGDDLAAWRVGLDAAAGLGQGAADGAWTAGLAAFRIGRWRDAAQAFDLVKSGSDDARAAAAFWAARSWERAGDGAARTARLLAAAALPRTFYGLIARRTLGMDHGLDWHEPDFITADWNYLQGLPGARRAAALAEIGQLRLADRELRHLAATAPADAYPAILRLAARLELPATQYSLAVRPPGGLEAPLSARFPAPDWVPARGWRLPRALILAHALQESAFITTATSRTGARGLMQLMPDTRDLVQRRIARIAGDPAAAAGDVAEPSCNFELGQTYLEMLGAMGITQGLLPKVMAAYNAGPGAVLKWNETLDDQGDPLLFIESIPYRETRHYVARVLRNLWMYELRGGASPASLAAIAAGLWPRLPGLAGPAAVQRDPAASRPRPTPGALPAQPLLPGWPDDDRVLASGR